MAQKFYLKADNTFLGSWDDGGVEGAVSPYEGMQECDTPPNHPKDVWNGAGWDAYDTSVDDAMQTLSDSDKQMARIAEDILAALIANGALEMADLPQDAQDVIADRQAARTILGA